METVMRDSMLTEDEIARRGRAIYERDIRAEVERGHDGGFLVVEVATGDYVVGVDDEEVFDLAEAKHPEGMFYLMRVGRPAAHRIGGSVDRAVVVQSHPTLENLIADWNNSGIRLSYP